MAVLTKRGIRFPLQKEPAAGRPIEELTAVDKLLLPLALRGEAGRCVLHPYTSVLSGQVVATPAEKDGAPVPSPVSGVYTDRRQVSHPLYGPIDCLVLDCMDTRRAAPEREVAVAELSADQIVEAARQCAVVDELDGVYVFEKLHRFAEEGCDVLVGDAVEDQPFASAAWCVLGESVEQVYEGLKLAAKAAGAADAHLAVQPLPANHRRALRQRLGEDRLLYITRNKYPAVKYTPKPFGKKVRRIGVQALLALYRAAAFGEAHTTGVVTVAGEAVATPRNLRVPFGTPAEDLFRYCGLSAEPTLYLYGDRMTGRAADTAEAPVVPGVTCLLALTDPPRMPAEVCVGCGRCVQVCHAGLLPFAIMQQYERGNEDRLPGLHPEDCDGCGACAAMCPAGLELAEVVYTVSHSREEEPAGETEGGEENA